MIVQFVLKGLFLYFIFLVVRSLFRGATQVNQMKEAIRQAQNGGAHTGSRGASSSKKANEDVVEAEFRRL